MYFTLQILKFALNVFMYCGVLLPRDAHYSAKCSIAIACRPSVYLSVRLYVTFVDQDHIGWKMEILETKCTMEGL